MRIRNPKRLTAAPIAFCGVQTEEIDTYLPVLAKLLSFSEADLQVVRDSFGEKEEWTFKLW
mgnify:CR=1 FL=1